MGEQPSAANLSFRVFSVCNGISLLNLNNKILSLPACSKAGFWMLISLPNLAAYLAVSLLSGSLKVFVPQGIFCTSWPIFSRSS